MQRNATMARLQNQPVADFHGLRDFYALVKTLAYTYRHSPQQRSYCNRTVLWCFIDGQMGSDPEFRNSIDVHFHSRCYQSGGIVQHTSSKLATAAVIYGSLFWSPCNINEVAELRSGLCQNLPIQSISLTANGA